MIRGRKQTQRGRGGSQPRRRTTRRQRQSTQALHPATARRLHTRGREEKRRERHGGQTAHRLGKGQSVRTAPLLDPAATGEATGDRGAVVYSAGEAGQAAKRRPPCLCKVATQAAPAPSPAPATGPAAKRTCRTSSRTHRSAASAASPASISSTPASSSSTVARSASVITGLTTKRGVRSISRGRSRGQGRSTSRVVRKRAGLNLRQRKS